MTLNLDNDDYRAKSFHAVLEPFLFLLQDSRKPSSRTFLFGYQMVCLMKEAKLFLGTGLEKKQQW